MNFLANPILRLGEKNIKTVFFTVIDNLFLFANPACASEFFFLWDLPDNSLQYIKFVPMITRKLVDP